MGPVSLSMRLINIHTLEFKEFFGRTRPGYAILSHRWGEREISYQDWLQYNGYHSRDSSSDTFVSRGPGYLKIIGFCRLIREATILWRPLNPDDNLKLIEWVWVDTCCIGKKSSAELSEAINSMYAWYRNAAICFVHLFDYSHMGEADMVESLGRCEWLSRGWTLQELLAPHYVCFYDVWWELFGVIRKFGFGGLMMEDYLGRLRRAPVNLYQNVSQITGISQHWLLGVNMSGVCLAEKMSWAAKRETTRVEDQAYCLLGIFGINMPLLYGEGHRAFGRLQKEIIGRSGDRSILLHTSWSRLLAESSQHFESQACVISIKQAGHILPYATTNVGLEFRDDLYYIPLDVGLESWRRPPDERNSQRLLNLNGRVSTRRDRPMDRDWEFYDTGRRDRLSLDRAYQMYLVLNEADPGQSNDSMRLYHKRCIIGVPTDSEDTLERSKCPMDRLYCVKYGPRDDAVQDIWCM